MHIVFICDPIDKQSAGIYQYTLQVVQHLWKLNNKHRLSFITLNSKVILDHIPAIPLPNTLKFLTNDPVRTFITLPRLINKLNPDIVIEPAHFGPFNLKKSVKRITVIHDLTPILYPQFHPFLSRFLQKIFLPTIIKKAQLIITNSENTTKDILNTYPNTQIKTKGILLGKDAIFKPSIDGEILDKYKITTPYLLTVATLEPRKNLTTLLQAFTLFKKQKSSNTKLVLIGGEGWKNNQLKAAIDHHPFKNDIILTFYMERKDMPAIFTQCEIFIYPSIYEGFGLPLLEAMACGAACISANNSSLPEVGGDAVLYFQTMNPNDLMDKIEKIFTNQILKKELKVKGLHQAKKFSWEKYAHEFMGILEDIGKGIS